MRIILVLALLALTLTPADAYRLDNTVDSGNLYLSDLTSRKALFRYRLITSFGYPEFCFGVKIFPAS